MPTQLNQNTTDLQSILDAVNALPEADGSGISLETCTVTITAGSTIYSITYMTVDANGAPIYTCITPNSTATQTLTCLCNSAIAINYNRYLPLSNSGYFNNCSKLHNSAYFCSVGLGNTDATIYIPDENAGGV